MSDKCSECARYCGVEFCHDCALEEIDSLESKNAELEAEKIKEALTILRLCQEKRELKSSLALLKEQYEECFMEYQKCGRERAILLEAVNAIQKHQEVIISEPKNYKISVAWFLCNKALEKIKE